jgi:hypothetical protein
MSQVIKAYNNLPPKTKQAINQAAAKTASAVAKATIQTAQRKRTINAARRVATRTRQGQRVYDPTDIVETQAIAPVAYSTKWASGAKSMRVRQSEIVGAVTVDDTWFPSWHGTFSANTFPINPANPKTFPWLSYIARLYDKYRFHSLKFRFINSVATSTTGNIIIALDYDTLDAAPESVVEASQTAKFTMTPTYVPSEFAVPVSHPGNNPWLYTYDISAGTKDLKTYNLGNLFICIDGLPKNGAVVGYLAVDYDVELLDKNPVVDVFASLTYDSGAPVAKRDRSNVDPADTMEIVVAWSKPNADAASNPLTITFSDNVPADSHVRLSTYVAAEMHNTANSSKTLKFGAPTVPDDVSVLTQRVTSKSADASAYANVATYLNLDITVPASRTITLTMKPENGVFGAATASAYLAETMAYSYA